MKFLKLPYLLFLAGNIYNLVSTSHLLPPGDREHRSMIYYDSISASFIIHNLEELKIIRVDVYLL